MVDELAAHHDPDAIDDAHHLRETTGGLALETASRHAGFMLGVEYVLALVRAGGVQ